MSLQMLGTPHSGSIRQISDGFTHKMLSSFFLDILSYYKIFWQKNSTYRSCCQLEGCLHQNFLLDF